MMLLPWSDAVRLDGGGRFTTEIDAVPDTGPTAAEAVPFPDVVELAVKLVEAPEVGETVPSPGGLTDHAALATETALPNASDPFATKACFPPVATAADAGDTLIVV